MNSMKKYNNYMLFKKKVIINNYKNEKDVHFLA